MGLTIFTSLIFILGFGILYSAIKTTDSKIVSVGKNKKKVVHSKTDVPFEAFIFVFLAALIFRLILAYKTKGHSFDMSCWSAWGAHLLSAGPADFYGFNNPEGYFCDYPPLYIYILGFIAKLINLFKISGQGVQFMYKLPAITCEMTLVAILFKEGSACINKRTGLILGTLMAFAPVFIFDSAVWGQIESLLALLMVLSLLRLYNEKYISSALIFVLAVLIKPQALLISPIYLFAFLSTKDFKLIGKAILFGILLFFGIIIPFSPAWSGSGSFLAKLALSLNPVWIIEKYMTTMASYKYFTVNAFNLYGLFKLNWSSLSNANAVFTGILNYGTIIGAILLSLFFYIKIQNKSSKIFLSMFILTAFLYTFGIKMHERYLVPFIIFLLIDFLFTRDKNILAIFAGFSTILYGNIAYVLHMVVDKNNAAPAYGVVFFISLLEVALFCVSIIYIYRKYVMKNIEDTAEISAPEIQPVIKPKKINDKKNTEEIIDSKKNTKMCRIDYLAMAIITLVYSVIAFINLGDMHAPQTFYQPSSTSESFVIKFAAPQTINKVTSYTGIGTVSEKPGLLIESSEDGTNWTTLSATATLKAVFSWNIENINPTAAQYIRCTPTSEKYSLFEMAFWNTDGKRVELDSIKGSNSNEGYKNIIDEQKYAASVNTYKNSTYFDEIYHPRTAYEHLHGLPYYETTHPPLGKLIMSVGIAIFGMTPFGWRVAGTLFGIFMLPMLYLFLKKLFGRTRYSIIGTLLFAFDFMHFTLTRMGTIDSYPVFFIICMYYFMYNFGTKALEMARSETPAEAFKDKKNLRKLYISLLLSGISFGLGAASKWISLYAGAGLAIEFFVFLRLIYNDLPKKKRANIFKDFAVKVCGLCAVFFIAIPACIYIAAYIPIAVAGHNGTLLNAVIKNQSYMFGYHSKLTATHPYSSKWYQWPIDYRPLWTYTESSAAHKEGQIATMSVFGNPFIWWSGIAAFFYSIIVGIKKRSRLILFLTIGLAAQYVPWMFITRSVFIYHFFASTPFMIFFIVYALRDLENRFPWFKHTSHVYVALCILLFALFYPVLSGTAVDKSYVETFLRWFKTWVFYS